MECWRTYSLFYLKNISSLKKYFISESARTFKCTSLFLISRPDITVEKVKWNTKRRIFINWFYVKKKKRFSRRFAVLMPHLLFYLILSTYPQKNFWEFLVNFGNRVRENMFVYKNMVPINVIILHQPLEPNKKVPKHFRLSRCFF